MSRLNMARKIKELHQNNLNPKNIDYYQPINEALPEKKYILSKMKDAYGQKGNYHLNEYNIEYSPNSSAIDRNMSNRNHLRLKNYKHSSNSIQSKNRGKSSYRTNNIDGEDANKNINIKNKIKEKENSFLIEMNNNHNNNISNNSNINDDEKNKTDKLYYKFDNNNNNFQTNIMNYFKSCKFLYTKNFDEIENDLINLWKNLGVKNNYINIFNIQKNNLFDIEEKTDFLILEIENLKKFEDILIKLSNEIESREKNINTIKELTEEMKKIEESENDINVNSINNKKIMDNFFNAIISYRVHSIKVVEYYLLFKEKIIQTNFKDKFDEDFLKKKYNLTKKGINYLMNMKTDMNFLTKLKLYSNKNKENIFESYRGDPFLTSLYNIIPASKENKQRIKYCEYYIIQENFNEKNIKENPIIKNVTHMNNDNNNNEYKNYQKKKLEPINYNSKYNTEINEKKLEKNTTTNDKTISIKAINNKNNSQIISEFDINNNKNDNNSIINEKNNINLIDDIVNLNIQQLEHEKDLIKNSSKISIIKNNDIKNNQNKKVENILQNSLILSKSIKKKSDKSRPVTPESKIIIVDNQNNNKIYTYNTSYYCGSLSDFIFIYNNYYKRIPSEQKLIFNIKENPSEYFHHNYFPKIIICSDTKLSLTKGICIYSIILNNDNKPNKIILEHISSYNNEEMENIIKNIFEFLKKNNILLNSNNNNINNEIYIDLYFYLENGKFNINANIRDFIKNELKFKWVKLENLSKDKRYQKMKHQFSNNDNDINNLLKNEIDDNNILNQSIIGKKALKDLNAIEDNDKYKNTDISSYDNSVDEDFNSNNIKLCNFYIRNKSVIKYINKSEIEKNIKNDIIKSNNNSKYINTFNIIYLIKKIQEDCIYAEYIENNTNNFFNKNDHLDIEEILNNNENISLNDILNNNSLFNSDLNKLLDFFNNKYNNKENKDEIIKNKFDIYSKMDLFPLFDNCISVKYKNIYFNRIENENIKILIEKETQQKFYFISPNNHKNDNIILLISSSLNNNFKEKYISSNDNDSNLSLKFIDIYNNITSSEEDDKGKDKDNKTLKKFLYIPSFIINSKIKLNYKKDINQENINNKEDSLDNNNDLFVMNKYIEYFNIKFISEDFIGKENNKNKIINSSINFYYDKIEEDINSNKDCLIDDNFIIFILNFDIIDNFAAIPLLSLYITKENFLSDKND